MSSTSLSLHIASHSDLDSKHDVYKSSDSSPPPSPASEFSPELDLGSIYESESLCLSPAVTSQPRKLLPVESVQFADENFRSWSPSPSESDRLENEETTDNQAEINSEIEVTCRSVSEGVTLLDAPSTSESFETEISTYHSEVARHTISSDFCEFTELEDPVQTIVVCDFETYSPEESANETGPSEPPQSTRNSYTEDAESTLIERTSADEFGESCKKLLEGNNQYPSGGRIGNYLLLGSGTVVSRTISVTVYDAYNIVTGLNCTCKVLPKNRYQELLAPYYRVGAHDHIVQLQELIFGQNSVYAFFPRHFGDLHSYVRSARRLRDTEASNLFRQIVSIVADCHDAGIVLRDLKLRKFVFTDPEKTHLVLESLDDAFVLDMDTDDDCMSDRHGCPAYVSPEILAASKSTYSGRAADIWSLGVVLYTILIGRYPFHDTDPVALFRLIRHGRYTIPRCAISEQAECLIRCILRCDPNERPSASEILRHPWFEACRLQPSRADHFYYRKLDAAVGSGTVNAGAKEREIDSCLAVELSNNQTVPRDIIMGSINEFNFD